MPRALITGINGFTGRYLADHLRSAGYEVFGTQLGFSTPPDAKTFDVNLLDLDRLKRIVKDIKPEIVAHLAAIAFVGESNIPSIYETNIIGTRNLLDALAAADAPVNNILIASSANIYGNSQEDPITEDALPQPANDYAVSKLAMEAVAKIWSSSLPITIVRPFNYTGVGQSPNFVIPKIVSQIRIRAKDISLGNIDTFREYNDVRFVAETYAKLLQRDPLARPINVCTGSVFSLRQVLAMTAELSGCEIEVRLDDKFVRRNEVHTLRGCDSRLQEIIRSPSSYSLHQTLSWMLTE